VTPGSSLPAALVLGGGTIAVPVARSLGASGVRVWAFGHGKDPVRKSRFCERFVDVGSGEGVQDRWLEHLADGGCPPGIVLPCNDDALELMARRRATIESLGHRAIEADDEVVLAMLDKERTYELARRAGVPAPRWRVVQAGADTSQTGEIPFPCIVKPRHSHLFQRHFGLRRKVFVARDEAQLERHLREMAELGLDSLVTEIVPGSEDAYHSYYTYIGADGEPLVHLTKRKLRQYPVGFGLATYHMIHSHEPAIEMGCRFFRSIGARGVANVEFKLDERDGELKLIECNHRFTAAQELVRHSGIDLALLAYNRVAGRPDPPLKGRVGVRMWLPVEDMRAFVDLRGEGSLSFLGWIRSLLHPQHFQLWSARDPLPSLVSVSRFVRVPRRLRRRRARRP
jgi:D-aspartate ligase